MADRSRRFTATVVGATGYSGAEIVRLLASHPDVAVVRATSERRAGARLAQECPWLDTDLVLESFDPASVDTDVVFLCQSAGFGMKAAPLLVGRTRVIDLGADFRLKPAEAFQTWYGMEHACPDLLEEAVYGLTELADPRQIASARILANPGCYPTSAALALAPLATAGMIAGTPVVDSKSGVSGAGRSKTDCDYLCAELSGGFRAYGVVGHRHTPEIEMAAGRHVRFTPHLLPFARGIHTTVHVPVEDGVDRAAILEAWRQAYAGRPFVAIQTEGWPSTKQVLGSNRCVLAADFDPRTGFATLVSVIDNLVKGAAGQAIQNMNLMLGLPEDAGLPRNGVWP